MTFMTSCGGGGASAKDMVLIEFLLVDQSQTPIAPTGTKSLPRNARILMVFSELVNPNSINAQTIQVRFGAAFQSVPTGSFATDANTVTFDPTVTAQGQPNPFGFEPQTQFIVDIPNFEEQSSVVENLDFDPILTTFFTSFTTGSGWIRELIPPEVTGWGFIPDPDPISGNIPGNGLMYFDFSEAMNPASFIPGGVAEPLENTTLDVRYTSAAINVGAGLSPPPLDPSDVGFAIPGTFSNDASATRFFFKPTFSFGTDNYEFFAQLFQGLKDLSGNLLVNPSTTEKFTCDGNGIADGTVIQEDFDNQLDRDPISDADWGSIEENTLLGQPISTREVYIFGYLYANNGGPRMDSGNGQYAPIPDPLTGADLNLLVPNVSPPTSLGRRVMWSYNDTEMGLDGAVTKVRWGPDSNATFAATYDDVILRMGFQKNASISLGTNFDGNYDGSPAVVFKGKYSVQQNGNVGNTPVPEGHPDYVPPGDPNYPVFYGSEPSQAHQGGYPQNPGCTLINPWNFPLFAATGFYPWPDLTTFFEWDDGDPGVTDDSVFLFDASVTEGDSFQQIRAWFGVTYPCSGVLLGGIPLRRLYTTYEDGDANPETNFGAGILNPEPTVMDMCFEITKRTSLAQSLFYFESGNPNGSPNGDFTFGDLSDYLPAELSPAIQEGGAQAIIEFQGADLVEDDRRTINQGAPFTGWTQDIDECDGMQKIRYRVSLVSNLSSGAVARLNSVRIPLISN